jgi:hypothetical protein
MTTHTFTTLPDGRVSVAAIEANEPVVRHYVAIGATIYVIPGDGPHRLLAVGDFRNPARLRDGETLEDAVRRLYADAPGGDWIGRLLSWAGFVTVGSLVGALAVLCALAAYWQGVIHLRDPAAPGLLYTACFGACTLWLVWMLSLLMRLKGAPWIAMLAVVALEGAWLAQWLHQPLF